MADFDGGQRPPLARAPEPAVIARGNVRAVRTLAAVAVVTLGLLVLWLTGHVLLIVFAGVLFAVFLLGLAEGVTWLTGLPRGWSLAVVALVLLAMIVVGLLVLAPQVATQLDDLWTQLARTIENFVAGLQRYSWAKALMSQMNLDKLATSAGDVLAGVTGAARGLMGLIGTSAIVAFLGLYLAAEPGSYAGGLLRLIPPHHRKRGGEVLARLTETLRWWLIGRAFSMLVVGALTYVGLLLLDVKLALVLALLAGLLDFVPYLGPIVAAIPAIGIAFADSPTQALYVAILYGVIQSLESYLLTPLVQRQAVSLPPAFTLTSQIFGGVFFGVLGVALATPLAAAGIVLVRMLYVEDVLGDRRG